MCQAYFTYIARIYNRLEVGTASRASICLLSLLVQITIANLPFRAQRHHAYIHYWKLGPHEPREDVDPLYEKILL